MIVKPSVFKMSGRWVWTCRDGHGVGGVGGSYSTEDYRDPHTVALAMANMHQEAAHADLPEEGPE